MWLSPVAGSIQYDAGVMLMLGTSFGNPGNPGHPGKLLIDIKASQNQRALKETQGHSPWEYEGGTIPGVSSVENLSPLPDASSPRHGKGFVRASWYVCTVSMCKYTHVHVEARC